MDKKSKEKLRIYKKYVNNKNLTKEENEFCDKIDWHPVDELPIREEFVKKMKKIGKGKYHKYSSIKELRKDIEEEK